MRLILFYICLFSFWPIDSIAQNEEFTYQYSINLNNVVNDRLEVTLKVTQPPQSSIFQFPSIVPGTYKVYDFGRFVVDFRVYDKDNNRINSKKLDANRWEIEQPHKVFKIKYWVNDTWDTLIPTKVFEPAGTNITENEVFVLNNHGFFGYFKGYENHPFKIKVSKNNLLYGSTSLKKTSSTSLYDTYEVKNYHRLVDNPILYSKADTTTLKIGNTDVFVSIYSPNNILDAKVTGEKLIKVLEAQKKFLNNNLPTDHYSFLIFLTDEPSNSGAMGALEHWNCSFYFLPEGNPSQLLPVIQEIAAHEFFHIITPLSIHSHEIAEFDYIEPKMSKHLWLYEGVTEYFASLALIKDNLISEEDYFDALLRKIITASTLYDEELPFTELSEKCLNEYGAEYGNVYEKGALIALGLDLILLENSNGEYNLRDLMLDLTDNFGANKSFEDDHLFSIIDSISGIPEAKEYLIRYVDNPNPLPYSMIFKKIGILYADEIKVQTTTFGNIGISFNENDEIFIEDISDIDDFGKNIGYQEGDILVKLNSIPITVNNIGELMNDYINNPKKFSKLKLVVKRDGKLIKLKSKTIIIEEIENNVFEKNDEASPQEKVLFEQWLEKN